MWILFVSFVCKQGILQWVFKSMQIKDFFKKWLAGCISRLSVCYNKYVFVYVCACMSLCLCIRHKQWKEERFIVD